MGGRVWFIATVLKTVGPQGSGGSNPSPSATPFGSMRNQLINKETDYGTCWYMNGCKHHPSLPAELTYLPCTKTYTKTWWNNDVKHRIDGPAVEHSTGRKEWWINGECIHVQLSEEEIDRIRWMRDLEREHRYHRTCPVTWETYGSNLNWNSYLVKFLKWFNTNVMSIGVGKHINNKFNIRYGFKSVS